MGTPATLSLYVARTVTLAVLGALAALSGLVALFDFIELLRRAATRPDASFAIVTEIASLRLPWVGMQILPFAVLVGGILAFWRLTRSSELIVARAAGVSAWQFLAAPACCAFALGIAATALVSPVSAVMRARAVTLEDQYLRAGAGASTLTGGQLWLRQSDHELDPQGVAILHAQYVFARGAALDAYDVSIFRLSQDDRLLERIEAGHAHLEGGDWTLDTARNLLPQQAQAASAVRTIHTDLTLARVQESFAPPDTFSVWALPGFIGMLDRSGFSSIRHRLQFQSLLALPLLCATMCLLAAAFSMRPQRRGNVAQMIASGFAAGFVLFMISKVSEEFGQSGALPPVLAAWAPGVAGLLLALSLLMHLEDG